MRESETMEIFDGFPGDAEALSPDERMILALSVAVGSALHNHGLTTKPLLAETTKWLAAKGHIDA